MAGDVGETRPRRWRWESLTGGGAILQQRSFRQFWLGRAITHIALNAVLYTLLVLAVGDSDAGSGIKSALFITAYLLPTATLGTISGVLIDRLPKNLTMAAVNVGRLGLMAILILAELDLWTIYGIALLLAMTSQFGSPAESSALPQLVAPEELTTANSVNNFAGLLSQVIGFAVLPPIFLNTVGPKPLFFVTAALFGLGAVAFFRMGSSGARIVDIDETVDAVREVRKQFAQAWDTLSRDLGAYMSVIIFVLSTTASLVAVTLMPRFVEETLGVPVRNSIFVFLPAAVGIFAGLRLVQWLEHRVAKTWLLGIGFVLLVASLACIALVQPLGAMLEDINLFGLFSPGPFGDTSARIVVTIVVSTAAAFSFAVIGVTSRAMVNERMPVGLQGRIFAAQYVLTNLASIPPILFAGVLTALVGVAPVMLLFLVIIVSVGGWTFARAAARPVRVRDAGTS